MPGDGPRGDWQPPGPKGLVGFPLRKKLIFTIVAFCSLVVIFLAAPFAGITKPWPPFRKLYGLTMWVSLPTKSAFNSPGSLPGSPPDKFNPSGTFRPEYRLFGLDSDGTGGACMIADIAGLVPANNDHKAEVLEGPCTKDEECDLGTKGVWPGHCIPDGPNQPSRCWYRPEENAAMRGQLCHTSGNHRNPTDPPAYLGPPWPVGVDQITPYTQTVANAPRFDLEAFYQARTNGESARWRVSGLLFDRSGGRHMRYGKPDCLSVDQKKKC